MENFLQRLFGRDAAIKLCFYYMRLTILKEIKLIYLTTWRLR